jgi:hypothetical protein
MAVEAAASPWARFCGIGASGAWNAVAESPSGPLGHRQSVPSPRPLPGIVPHVRYAVFCEPPLEVIEEEIPGAEVRATAGAHDGRRVSQRPLDDDTDRAAIVATEFWEVGTRAHHQSPANPVQIVRAVVINRSPRLNVDLPLIGSFTDPPFADPGRG